MTGFQLQQQIESTPENDRESPQFARLVNDLGVACHHSNLSEAESHYKRALAILEKTLGSEHPYVGVVLGNLAAVYRKVKAFDEAERLFQLALRIERKATTPVGSDTPSKAEQYDSRGILTEYGAEVRDLRARVVAGSSEAREEMKLTIERLGPWYHNLNYGGFETNPATPDYPASRFRLLDPLIPQDLRGKTVLDIGCNSGFFSLEMKKRGADRVVGIDIMPHVLAQSRFASHWFGQPIELHELGAYDVEKLDMQFDIVVFIGVLYHLKHPLYALEKVASVCRDTMYLMSVVRGSRGDFHPEQNYPITELSIFDHPDYPRMFFLEKSYNSDESNWWFATRSCLKAMARTAGFPTVEETEDPELLVCRK